MTNEFFKSLVLQEAEAPKPKVEKLEGLVLKVTKSGKITPSEELVKTFNLEYKTKGIHSNGVDIFNGSDWTMLNKEVLIFGIIPRGNNSINIWGSTKYEGDTPVSSVLTQSTSYGKELFALAQSLALYKESDFYILEVKKDFNLKVESGIYYTPRKITRGEDKGSLVYVRRDGDVAYFPIDIKEENKQASAPEPIQDESPFSETVEIEDDPFKELSDEAKSEVESKPDVEKIEDVPESPFEEDNYPLTPNESVEDLGKIEEEEEDPFADL